LFITLKLKKALVISFGVLLFAAIIAIMALSIKEKNDEIVLEAMAVTEDAYEGDILIIDAGHGGLDGGASTSDGVTESDINLAVALKMEAVANFLGISTVMTRESADLNYPESESTIAARKVWDQKTRVDLINSIESGYLISVHQNSYPDARPRGSQVLYAKTEGSQTLGEIAHSNLIEQLNPDNRRVAAPISESIFLMKSVNCPAILVECGFLSNKDEAAILQTEEYKTKLAIVLVASYLQFCDS